MVIYVELERPEKKGYEIAEEMERSKSTEEKMQEELKYEIYNLGGDNPVTLMDFISYIEKALGKEAKKNFLPMQPGDVKETFADISKAREELGFEPKTKIDEGIKIFCDWFVENKDWLLELEEGKQ